MRYQRETKTLPGTGLCMDHPCSILAKNLASFYLYPENLNEVGFKANRIAEETFRQESIQASEEETTVIIKQNGTTEEKHRHCPGEMVKGP